MRISPKMLVAVASLSCFVGPAAIAQDAASKDPAQARAGAYTLDPAHGKVTWSVNHLGFSTYTGQFGAASAKLKLDPKNLAAATLEASVDLNSVDGANEQFEKHMKSPDFFDVAKFPTASFKSTSVKRTGERTADIAGDLTLKGVTKPIVIKATFNQGGPHPMSKAYMLGFDGEATIKRTDFGMSFLAPMIGDEVKLQIEGEFKSDAAAPAAK